MQSCIQTYYRLDLDGLTLTDPNSGIFVAQKEGTFDSPGLPAGPLISASMVAHPGEGGRTKQPRLAEVVPNGLVALQNMRSESSGIFYSLPLPHTSRGRAEQNSSEWPAWRKHRLLLINTACKLLLSDKVHRHRWQLFSRTFTIIHVMMDFHGNTNATLVYHYTRILQSG